MQQQQQTLAAIVGAIAQNMSVTPPAQHMPALGIVAACGLFECFKCLRPLMFVGTHRPKEAKYWLNCISKIIRPPHYSEAEQVQLVTNEFKKEAGMWWDNVLRIVPMGLVWTWDEFEMLFHEYFPLTYRNEKEGEFLCLKQGGIMVTKYKNRFTELSSYAPLIVVNEPMKMRRFSKGLRADIRVVLASICILTW
ncbi:uncharacterized protein LOC131224897 [Magnolia sinica]|uniref:uncharacterized protein LOC131224897 n=1 Tax=Magnolia sinica TaxID=86752 RepID=UPI0026590A7E|nr:uncharacterized protein LOC131224897 [Magnolia sinica]